MALGLGVGMGISRIHLTDKEVWGDHPHTRVFVLFVHWPSGIGELDAGRRSLVNKHKDTPRPPVVGSPHEQRTP